MTDGLGGLITSLRSRGMPSVRNILVTVFGDALRPYGAAVSVQSLTSLLEPLGVSERLVRTSLTRLADERIVVIRRVGNRSFYGVEDSAQALFEKAEEKIYRSCERRWDGRWTLVIIDGSVGTSDQRAELRHQLTVLGLGPIAPNVMASPVVGGAAVAAVVHGTDLRHGVLVTQSTVVDGAELVNDLDLATRVMVRTELAQGYDEIIDWFTPLTGVPEMSAADSFVARTLLIAAYRRVVLSDPGLPDVLVSNGWSGRRAFTLVAQLYGEFRSQSEARIVEVCETPDGPLRMQQISRPRFGSA